MSCAGGEGFAWLSMAWGVASRKAFACGCTPAFGRVVGVFDAGIIGPAEAVPFRSYADGGCGGGMEVLGADFQPLRVLRGVTQAFGLGCDGVGPLALVGGGGRRGKGDGKNKGKVKSKGKGKGNCRSLRYASQRQRRDASVEMTGFG
jgi:hypothetical protein